MVFRPTGKGAGRDGNRLCKQTAGVYLKQSRGMAGGQVSWRRLGTDKVRKEGALTL